MLHYLLNFFSADQLNAFLKGAPSYYNSNKAMPILEKLPMERKILYSVDGVVKLLLCPNVRSSGFVAMRVPTMISYCFSFLLTLIIWVHQRIFCPMMWECGSIMELTKLSGT